MKLNPPKSKRFSLTEAEFNGLLLRYSNARLDQNKWSMARRVFVDGLTMSETARIFNCTRQNVSQQCLQVKRAYFELFPEKSDTELITARVSSETAAKIRILIDEDKKK